MQVQEVHLLILLPQIAVIIGLSRALGTLFNAVYQPKVMGEMIAGIMLGPSVLGLVAPQASAMLFPPATLPYLAVLSNLGVIFFLFLVGLELNPKMLRGQGHTAFIISNLSILAPFLLGAALTLYLYPRLFNQSPRTGFVAAALFLGASMSVTAFPVLARILTERNLHRTRMGAVALTCAAVNDATAWCILAFAIAVARASGLRPALHTLFLSILYVLVMFAVVRPLLARLQVPFDRREERIQGLVALVVLLVLASAWVTDWIGIHALFGAFVMGAVMPKGARFVHAIGERLEDFTVVLLLPIFFAYTGLQTQLGLLNRPELWADTLLIIVVACLGKWGGSMIGGRSCGMGWREASAVGVLMNTRGLVELIILNIGLQLGVITPIVFAMMIIMALVTTALTTPVLHYIYPRRLLERAIDAAGVVPFSVLIPVALPRTGAVLARLAATMIGTDGGNAASKTAAESAGDGAAKKGAGGGATGPKDLAKKDGAKAGKDESSGPLPPELRMDESGGKTASKVYALHMRRPRERGDWNAAEQAETESGTDATLAPLLAQAQRDNLPVESISVRGLDVAAGICRVAAMRAVSLVLMGFSKPMLGKTVLGGTVHRVLNNCRSDVAIFVDRAEKGITKLEKIMVPYLGGRHDRRALELAARMASHTKARVTVLHVVPPKIGGGTRHLDARGALEAAFSTASGKPVPGGQAGEKATAGGTGSDGATASGRGSESGPADEQAELRVVEDSSPVTAVLRESEGYDLVVLGIAEEWGLESHLFGWRPERIARECKAGLLIVRRATSPQSEARAGIAAEAELA
jgi:Kef-type K+ transport system membrane component KefB/nucleotide-binding universal stress UspA family protein